MNGESTVGAQVATGSVKGAFREQDGFGHWPFIRFAIKKKLERISNCNVK